MPKGIPRTHLYLTPKDIARFWSSVNKTDECWLWIGYIDDRNNPIFRKHPRVYLAHRVAYFLTHDHLPDKHYVKQTCNNPHCVRPDHLIAEKPPSTPNHAGFPAKRPPKLNIQIADDIRAQYRTGTFTLRQLAQATGLHKKTISKIVNNRIYPSHNKS